jgi:hypothetical protein
MIKTFMGTSYDPLKQSVGGGGGSRAWSLTDSIEFIRGTLTKGEGSVRLTSSSPHQGSLFC